MSDLSAWQQKILQMQVGIRAGAPAIQGPQEAVITKVGTASLSIDGGPATSYPCVWFSLPNTYGSEAGFGPAPYEVTTTTVPPNAFGTGVPSAPVTLTAQPPQVGDVCIVVFAGNGPGRPYVVSFL